MSHTPGPWIYNGLHVYGPVDARSRHANGRVIVGGVVDEINDWRGVPPADTDDEAAHIRDRAAFAEERKANGRLMAAAPSMLYALRRALLYLEHPDVQAINFAAPAAHALQMVRMAIGEAIGEADTAGQCHLFGEG